MSEDVQFDEKSYEPLRRPAGYKDPDTQGIVGLVMKTHLAKNKVQANLVMIIISVLCIIVAILVAVYSRASQGSKAFPLVKQTYE